MGSRRKAYVAGSREDVQVPFCEVVLDPPNEPVRGGTGLPGRCWR